MRCCISKMCTALMLIEQVALTPSFRKRAQLVVHSTFFSAVLISGQIKDIRSPPSGVIVAQRK